MEKRISDAAKLGFKRLLVPNHGVKDVTDIGNKGIELIRTDTLYDAASEIFSSKLLNGDKQ